MQLYLSMIRWYVHLGRAQRHALDLEESSPGPQLAGLVNESDGD